MVGAAFSALLASHPMTSSLRIAIVDQQEPALSAASPACPDLRVSTIVPASVSVIQDAGAWPDVEQHAQPFHHMQVWDHAGRGGIRWSAADVGLPSMGVVVENRTLQAALLRSALAPRAVGGVDGLWGTGIEAIHPPSAADAPERSHHDAHDGRPGVTGGSADSGNGAATSSNGRHANAAAGGLMGVTLSNGRRLQCRLLVGADGGRSHVRKLACLRTVGWQYGQRGVVATVTTDTPNDTAWQRFLATGPLALLPVRGGYSNIVWSTTPEHAHQLEALGSADFAEAANVALQQPETPVTGGLFGQMWASLLPPLGPRALDAPPLVLGVVGSPPKSFPLQMQHSGRYVSPRLALIGDAAHTVHPMAGQGVNLGLADAATLASTLTWARQHGCDIGDVAVLQERYQAPRQAANSAMIAALEALNRVFGVQSAAFGATRAVGLSLLDALPPVKNRIMRFAMGLPAGGGV